jgi:hypothetical protein
MKQGITIGAVLVALSISATSAATAAAPYGGQRQANHHRPSLVQVIKHKAMGMIAAAKGAAMGAGAREARMKAAMAAKAKRDPRAMSQRAPS